VVIIPPPRRICNGRCLYVCLSVCLLPTLRKYFWTDLQELFKEGWQGPMKKTIKFWWRSGSRIRIATLVRRALAEVCTVPVLLVMHVFDLILLVGWCGLMRKPSSERQNHGDATAAPEPTNLEYRLPRLTAISRSRQEHSKKCDLAALPSSGLQVQLLQVCIEWRKKIEPVTTVSQSERCHVLHKVVQRHVYGARDL